LPRGGDLSTQKSKQNFPTIDIESGTAKSEKQAGEEAELA